MSRLIFLIAILITSLFFSCSTDKNKERIIEGKSQSIYISEPYVGFVKLTMKGESISNVEFQIKDTLNNEVFDSNYETHYPDNEEYRIQCQKDWQGVLNYPQQLLSKQDINKVDAVSGATWSYNLFKASVETALKELK